MKKPSKPSDREIRKRMVDTVGLTPPDGWELAIRKLRHGRTCCVVNRGAEVHVIFAKVTIEEIS